MIARQEQAGTSGACWGDTRSNELREALARVPGFAWSSTYHGELALGAAHAGLRAGLRVETPEHVVLRVRIDDPPAPRAALSASHRFHGSLRHAHAEATDLLVADLRADTPEGLCAALDEVLGDLAARTGPAVAEESTPASQDADDTRHATELADVLAELAADGLEVVERPGGGELRMVLARRGHAVQVTWGKRGGVRLTSRLVRDLPGGRVGEALSDWALRANARCSLARLVCADGALVAETWLAAGPLSPASLAAAAWAVAGLAEQARTPVQLLTTERRVALGYARCFLDPKARGTAGGE